MTSAKLIGIAMVLICGAALHSAGRTAATPPQTATSSPARAKTSVKEDAAVARRDYVGDAACQECHREIAETYALTAHHRTSQIPTKDSIVGTFTAGANTFMTGDPDLHFRMDARENGFYETAVFGQPPHEKTRTERIDLIIGSGGKGQTYLYWRGNQLFLLPVSYWKELKAWINSPGLPDAVADFNRPILPVCLECHASYFARVASVNGVDSYKKTDYVLGVTCERCHGPGREHVENERLKTAGASAGTSFIVNPAKLSKEREIEVCGQCHGGLGQRVAPAFSYIPGQPLADYLVLPRPDPAAHVDVHGNQVALMQRSRCYQNAELTCKTCHDEHAPERQAASYSVKCLQCHKDSDCGEFAKLGAKIRENCVDCHMPMQQTNLMFVNVEEQQIQARMRNHWIRVYSTGQNP